MFSPISVRRTVAIFLSTINFMLSTMLTSTTDTFYKDLLQALEIMAGLLAPIARIYGRISKRTDGCAAVKSLSIRISCWPSREKILL